MFITMTIFEGDENGTTEINRSTTAEWADIKYERAVNRWYEIISILCAKNYNLSLPLPTKLEYINLMLKERSKDTGKEYSFEIRQYDSKEEAKL